LLLVLRDLDSCAAKLLLLAATGFAALSRVLSGVLAGIDLRELGIANTLTNDIRPAALKPCVIR
jgi:hypothetical protein